MQPPTAKAPFYPKGHIGARGHRQATELPLPVSMAHPALSNMKVRTVGKNHTNTDHFCRGKKFSEAPLKEDWLGKEEAIATICTLCLKQQ